MLTRWLRPSTKWCSVTVIRWRNRVRRVDRRGTGGPSLRSSRMPRSYDVWVSVLPLTRNVDCRRVCESSVRLVRDTSLEDSSCSASTARRCEMLASLTRRLRPSRTGRSPTRLRLTGLPEGWHHSAWLALQCVTVARNLARWCQPPIERVSRPSDATVLRCGHRGRHPRPRTHWSST